MDISALVVTDIAILPPAAMYENLNTWLDQLVCTYTELISDGHDDADVIKLAQKVITNVSSTRRLLQKVQFAVRQHNLLDARVLLQESRTSRTEQLCEPHHATWNQIQVYKGLREVYGRCVTKLSVQLVDSFLLTDNTHELFLDHFCLVSDDELNV